MAGNASVEVTFTPPDLIRRMNQYPDKLLQEMEKTGNQTLRHVQGSVPEYPPPPPNSRYRRTGTLGRGIGSGGGQAQIYEIRAISAGFVVRLGTRVKYAPDVIGEGTQKPIHAGRWWTTRTILDRATPGIERLYTLLAERLAAFLEGH